MRKDHALIALLAVALIVAATACSGDDEGGGGGGTSEEATTIDVVEQDFSITPTPEEAPAGIITFAVKNDGPSTHEFVVFQTDLNPDALPLADDGTVDEAGEGLTAVDEIEDVAPGDTPELELSLDAGHYVLICNLPGHYAQGMHAELEVA